MTLKSSYLKFKYKVTLSLTNNHAMKWYPKLFLIKRHVVKTYGGGKYISTFS